MSRHSKNGFPRTRANPLNPITASVVLKHLPQNVFNVLCHIFNQPLLSRKLIPAFKKAKIVPKFKKGNLSDVSNYRSIRLVSTFSKLLEKDVHIRSSLLKCHNILNPDQFGFRKNQSTSHSTTLFISKTAHAFERKESVIGIFLDLFKAFDTIDHNIAHHR